MLGNDVHFAGGEVYIHLMVLFLGIHEREGPRGMLSVLRGSQNGISVRDHSAVGIVFRDDVRKFFKHFDRVAGRKHHAFGVFFAHAFGVHPELRPKIADVIDLVSEFPTENGFAVF